MFDYFSVKNIVIFLFVKSLNILNLCLIWETDDMWKTKFNFAYVKTL